MVLLGREVLRSAIASGADRPAHLQTNDAIKRCVEIARDIGPTRLRPGDLDHPGRDPFIRRVGLLLGPDGVDHLDLGFVLGERRRQRESYR